MFIYLFIVERTLYSLSENHFPIRIIRNREAYERMIINIEYKLFGKLSFLVMELKYVLILYIVLVRNLMTISKDDCKLHFELCFDLYLLEL